MLADREVARRFGEYQRYCDHVSGPEVNAQDIHRAVKLVISYGDHVRECLIAHIDEKPLPAEPHPAIPALD